MEQPTFNLQMQKDRELRQIQLLESIESLLKRVVSNTMPAYSQAVRFEFAIRNTKTGAVGDKNMNLLLNEDAEISVKGIKDAAGNDATVEGDKLSWSVAGAQDLGELTVSEDGKSAKFARNGKVGTCQIEVRGDADLGPEEKIIIGSVELVCLGGQAERFELEAVAVPKAV